MDQSTNNSSQKEPWNLFTTLGYLFLVAPFVIMYFIFHNVREGFDSFLAVATSIGVLAVFWILSYIFAKIGQKKK